MAATWTTHKNQNGSYTVKNQRTGDVFHDTYSFATEAEAQAQAEILEAKAVKIAADMAERSRRAAARKAAIDTPERILTTGEEHRIGSTGEPA